MKKQTDFIVNDISELEAVADKLAEIAQHETVILFEGNLGAGKTSLIKVLCEKLGVLSDVSSPTYSIVNEYETEEDLIYHIDLYRIHNVGELQEIGFSEYVSGGWLCLIEWPEIARSILPKDCVEVHLQYDHEQEKRTISIIEK